MSGLSVGLQRRGVAIPLVHDVSLDVGAGERLGIVGESGSGKSLTMLAVMGLLNPPLCATGGSIVLEGKELLAGGDAALRRARGVAMGMIYQDPMTSLNPMIRIGTQVAEGLRAHGVGRDEARERSRKALIEVGLTDAHKVERLYPHQLSGGMRQRVMIASALVTAPKLLIADEPTTALDVTIQRQILRLVAKLQKERNMAVVWATHDLGVVAQFAHRVAVMYAGRVVEIAPTRSLFRQPEHPYSAALLGSLPIRAAPGKARMSQIPGIPPDPTRLPVGCPFHPRCAQATQRCRVESPALTERRSGSMAACFVPPENWTRQNRP